MGNYCATLSIIDEKNNVGDKINLFSLDYDVSNPSANDGYKTTVLDNPTGTEIEETYVLGKEMGRGEFGIIYMCTHKSTGEVFACKSISKNKLTSRVDIEDVRREVEIMKHMPPHPNIVSLKDTYEDDSAVHLVMELCEGGELFDQIVARGHYAERAAAGVIKIIVEVIQRSTILDHPWIQNAKKAPNVFLDETIKARLEQFSIMNKLKKRALRVIAEHLSTEEVAGIKQGFDLMDTNRQGKINVVELKAGLQKLGHQIPDADLQILMEEGDVDKEGFLNYGESIAISVHLRKMGNDDHLKDAFAIFDKNQSGYIEIEELREALADDADEANSEEVISAIIHDVDTDNDGKISFEEFTAMMKAGTDWRKVSRQYSRERYNNLSLTLFQNGFSQ
ncbi:hypothetical protein M8C21_004493 [Ambrosia artemisiifolia]|uniref:non-specific serine/threonine protein kinase n=1 Tax=Ambrosia artemisiifolia TaxID=4212 RepID=A0AAD5CP54_AMBAR|nr:hypothetical protein M8C21_004493 [Ambrosia artemisiifolia]